MERPTRVRGALRAGTGRVHKHDIWGGRWHRESDTRFEKSALSRQTIGGAMVRPLASVIRATGQGHPGRICRMGAVKLRRRKADGKAAALCIHRAARPAKTVPRGPMLCDSHKVAASETSGADTTVCPTLRLRLLLPVPV